jgi:1,2-diacylglycerol 3-beta-glucosyltransferase
VSSLRSLVRAADIVSSSLSLPVAGCGVYLGALTVAARRQSPAKSAQSTRFVVVVPAHNEALVIEQAVVSLQTIAYPTDKYRIVVIADNCTDETAAIARTAGAKVVERFDDKRRSKGYALTDVFPQLLEDTWVDAVVVVDADTIVSSNILSAISARFERGELAAQVDYRVMAADSSWRTELMGVAFACFHEVRSLGRERFGLSSGLRGNGMAFTRRALEIAPHTAASLVEDLEYGIELGELGVRVAYVGEAFVEAEMPTAESSAATQRQRWEAGRADLKKRKLNGLIRRSISERDLVLADLALDLAVPPLGKVAVRTVASGTVGLGLLALRRGFVWTLIPASVGALGLLSHVAAGWHRSGSGWNGLRALTKVPGYVLWKRKVASPKVPADSNGGTSQEWVRTARNAEHEAQPVSTTRPIGLAAPCSPSPAASLSTSPPSNSDVLLHPIVESADKAKSHESQSSPNSDALIATFEGTRSL